MIRQCLKKHNIYIGDYKEEIMGRKVSFFYINAEKYVPEYNFYVECPSSLMNPKSNSVMFIMGKYVEMWKILLTVQKCLVFWPEEIEIPEEVRMLHAVFPCQCPRREYCLFFKDNHIQNLPKKEPGKIVDGTWISEGASIHSGVVMLPGSYIGGEVSIGKDCYIGTGVRLVGAVSIGERVIIRENTVIGADGLSTERNINGSAETMPQFGGVTIGNDVEIGANTVIGRGAIDDTIIESGCKIDNSVFISHNVKLGRDTFVVGEAILFGSSSTGERAYISGNATIRNKVKVGSDTIVGMGAVVTKDVQDGDIVMGNPAVRKKQQEKNNGFYTKV